MTTLQERLRKLPAKTCGNPVEDLIDPLVYEAADTLDSQAAELERLRVFEQIFVKHRAYYSSGCACDLSEEDDGSAEFAEHGLRIARWCEFHKWHRDVQAARIAELEGLLREARPLFTPFHPEEPPGYCCDAHNLLRRIDAALNRDKQNAHPL